MAAGGAVSFSAENLNQRVGRLSGSERARLDRAAGATCGRLAARRATNDLDVPTPEIQESLLEYSQALVLVTHGRFMLDRVSTVVLGLMNWTRERADYSQWDAWRAQLRSHAEISGGRPPPSRRKANSPVAAARKNLYQEARTGCDGKENRRSGTRTPPSAALEDPAVTDDRIRLQDAPPELMQRRGGRRLYARGRARKNQLRCRISHVGFAPIAPAAMAFQRT